MKTQVYTVNRLFITEKFTVKLRGVRMMRKHWNPMIGAAIALSLGGTAHCGRSGTQPGRCCGPAECPRAAE